MRHPPAESSCGIFELARTTCEMEPPRWLPSFSGPSLPEFELPAFVSSVRKSVARLLVSAGSYAAGSYAAGWCVLGCHATAAGPMVPRVLKRHLARSALTGHSTRWVRTALTRHSAHSVRTLPKGRWVRIGLKGRSVQTAFAPRLVPVVYWSQVVARDSLRLGGVAGCEQV